LTVARFCQQEQVSVSAFYQWRKQLAAKSDGQRDHSSAPSAPPAHVRGNAFVPVTILPAAQLTRPAPVEVRLNNGVRLRLPSGEAATLRQILRVVSQLPAGVPRADGREDAAC
jgi:hypothetical protein